MVIQHCTKTDFDQILSNLEQYWDSNKTINFHHPMLIYEFGDTAFVIKLGETVCGYLFGFYSQANPYAYVHLIGIHKSYRRKGYGKALYEYFIEKAKDKKCTHMKAITTLLNVNSINIHKSIGMELIGKEIQNGIAFTKNYSGPNEDRVVFLKKII